MPTVGGVAVFVAFVVAVAQFPLLNGAARTASTHFFSHVVALIVASFAVMAVGVLDDVRGVRPRTKLAVQAVAAVGLYLYGFRVERLANPFGSAIDLGYWALPVTVVWLVGMSNAFDLIDGMMDWLPAWRSWRRSAWWPRRRSTAASRRRWWPRR